MKFKYSSVFYFCNISLVVIMLVSVNLDLKGTFAPLLLMTLIYVVSLSMIVPGNVDQMNLSKKIDFAAVGVAWGVIGIVFSPIEIRGFWEPVLAAAFVASSILIITREFWAPFVDLPKR